MIVTSDEPVSVAVHRPWKEHRQLTGRLMHAGVPYRVSIDDFSRVVSRTILFCDVVPRGPCQRSSSTSPRIASALPCTERSARERFVRFRLLDQKTPATGTELELQATGVYSGRIVDEDGKPVWPSRIRLFPLVSNALINDALLEEAVLMTKADSPFNRRRWCDFLARDYFAGDKIEPFPRVSRGDKELHAQARRAPAG